MKQTDPIIEPGLETTFATLVLLACTLLLVIAAFGWPNIRQTPGALGLFLIGTTGFIAVAWLMCAGYLLTRYRSQSARQN